MKSLKGKRIFIFQQRKWGAYIGHYLAKKLQSEGCVLGAVTSKRTTHNFVVNQKEVRYDYLWSNDDLVEDPKKYLKDFNFTLKEICQELQIDSIWPIVATSRHHTKSYKDKFYYGFRQNVSDDEIIDYVKVLYGFIEKTFNEFKPDLIISPNFVTIFHLMFYYYAKKEKIKMIAMNDSKIHGVYLSILDPCASEGMVFDRFNEIEKLNFISKNKQKAKVYIKNFRDKFIIPDYTIKINEAKQKKGFYKKIKNQLSPYYYIYRWYRKKQINYLKTIGASIDYRPPKIILRDFYCYKKYERFINNYKYDDIKKIKKFIYFPLQFQPEATIDVQSSFFSNQIETARLVAMSLPDDYTLVVKEHPAMVGYRPPSYIEKIARTPNIKLVDYRVSSEEAIKRSSMIISPSSTTLAEAAFLKKPSIQLGDLGLTLLLPNIIKHSNLSTLSGVIKEHLNINLNNYDYEKKLINYVSAVYDVGIEFDYIGAWDGGEKYDREKLWNFYKKNIYYYLGVK